MQVTGTVQIDATGKTVMCPPTVQSGVLSKVMEKGGSRLGIFSSSVSQKPLGNSYLSVDVVLDTPEMQSQLAGLDDAPVLLKPWIQPID